MKTASHFMQRSMTDLETCFKLWAKRQIIADSRWERLQDAYQKEHPYVYEFNSDVEEPDETPLALRLNYLCDRAQKQSEDIAWRIEEAKKAYSLLEEILTDARDTIDTNNNRRYKKHLVTA